MLFTAAERLRPSSSNRARSTPWSNDHQTKRFFFHVFSEQKSTFNITKKTFPACTKSIVFQLSIVGNLCNGHRAIGTHALGLHAVKMQWSNKCATNVQHNPKVGFFLLQNVDVSKNSGKTPKWMVKIMVPNLLKMDPFWGENPLRLETQNVSKMWSSYSFQPSDQQRPCEVSQSHLGSGHEACGECEDAKWCKWWFRSKIFFHLWEACLFNFQQMLPCLLKHLVTQMW